ncbi:hypothetical protein Tco_1448367 [Tanacetum coccineum]
MPRSAAYSVKLFQCFWEDLSGGPNFEPNVMDVPLLLDHEFDFFIAEPVPGLAEAPDNQNRWIEWDVPLGGEMDEPMENLGFNDKEELNEFMDDDQDVGDEEIEEWLMAPVTPPRATVTVPSNYEVGGPSTATPVGHPLTTMTYGVATQPQVIDDLCDRMSNLEYRHGELAKKMVIVSDAEVTNRITIWEIHPRVTTLEGQVLDLEKVKDAQAKEIAGLKKRVQKLERKKKSRTIGKMPPAGRSFKDIDKDAKVSLVYETQGRTDDAEMFDTDDLYGDEVIVDMAVAEKQEQSAKVDERNVSTGIEDSATSTILVTIAGEGVTATKIDEITLAQTLIEIKAAKPKAVTTAATTTTTTRPKARGVVVQEPSEFRTTTSSPQASQPSKTKDKGKAIMIKPERKLARKKEEEANIALIESWENTQAMMEADRLLAERLQTREQEELTDEEKAKLFMEFMEKRRKHFAALRAQEKRKRPPTKTQKRNQMSIYLKHMGGYKHNQLKGRSYDEIQKLFDKEMKRVNSFVAMNSEAQEISGKKDESSSKKAEIAQDSSAKRAGDKLESDKSKKQKTDENEEVEVDNEAELKEHMVTVKDDDIAIDAIPLATKPPVICIDREDLQTLWKLVKIKHGDTRLEDEHERVLWGDLKVMFEPDIKSDVWRNLQGYKVTGWKLFDSCGVHFVSTAGTKVYAAGLQLLEELLLSEG